MNLFSGIIPIIITIIVFGVLIVSHEFGHFFVAKKNGIFVEEFAVGMGPKLFSKQIGETLYSLRAIPFGGYCKMLGEEESSNDERAFNNKTPLQRMAVVAAGPIMNFIFAFILVFAYNAFSGTIFPVVNKILPESNAAQGGLEAGDKILSINGQSVTVYDDLSLIMDGCNGEDVVVKVKKDDGSKETYTIKPSVSTDNRWIIGFSPVIKSPLIGDAMEGYERSNIIEVAKESFFKVIFFVKSTVIGFVRLFTFKVSPDEVAGPIGMVQIIGDSYTIGLGYSLLTAILNVIYLAALFSANLGAINLFPIPAMDGGRLVFLIIEKIRGRALDADKEGFVHYIGFLLLFGFMILIAFNDLRRIFF